ncbi:MAG: site-specific DNA-methyltransferase [Leuconostoc falkenbergense]|uniref:site-specific DNA-methyltransferase n=1 Tax=Leuconostoc falkenbergense TaxID=2766470 RepID=UPI0039E888D1
MVNEIFHERPHANEKQRGINYINKLLDAAHNNKDTSQGDINELEEIKRLLNQKKYGLVWERHAEQVEEELKTKIPIFVEDESKKIVGDHDKGLMDNYNFILEGDNLHSLHLLEKTHKGRIDVIYIDPPYNTKNKDFKYNDTFVAPDDAFRHSKWLSFMESRLRIAQNLLADNGVIFISIDENENAQLKLLMDEIFGENNILSVHQIQVRYGNKNLNEKKDFQELVEQVLIYAKNKHDFSANLPVEKYSIDKFSWSVEEIGSGTLVTLGGKKVTIFKKGQYKINKLKQPSLSGLKATWASGSVLKGNTSGKFFDLQLAKRKDIDGLEVLYKVEGIGEDGLGYRYFTGPKKLSSIRGQFYSGIPLDRIEQLKAGVAEKNRPIINFYDFSSDFGNIRHEGGVSFNSGKKPLKMIKQFLKYHKSKNINVLDFFAGSGTTGQAVVELNAEDGGNRKFILATNNENNIAEEITYGRMKWVADGTDKYDAHPMNLKYFKTSFIEKDNPDLESELLANVRTLVELQHGVNLNDSTVDIVTTLSEVDQIDLPELKIVYMRSQVKSMLTQKQVLRYKEADIELVEIPESYFSKELRENGL